MRIPCKTVAGHAELVAGGQRLSQRHRAVLFLVDGQRTLDEVVRLGAQAGVSKAYVDELIALGLIVMTRSMPAAVDAGQPSPAAWSSSAWRDADAGDTLGPGMPLGNTELMGLDQIDTGLAEARELLAQTLRAAAPVSAIVTLLRLRRVRSRAELRQLLPEVQARLSRLLEAEAANQLLRRVERLIES